MGSLRATALALIVTTTTAHAQPKPTQAQIQQAGDLVKKAIAKSQAGDHALAIELYQQAYNVIPTPILLSNIGSEYQQAQKPADAIKYFCKYLDAEPTGDGAKFATSSVKSLQTQLGNDVEDNDACKLKPKPAVVAAPLPVVDQQPIGGSNFGPTGGPSTDVQLHPGRGLEIGGVTVAVVGAVFVGLGVHYALEGRALQNDINSHDPNTMWPASYEGVPIKDWDSQGHSWNVDAAVFSAIGGALVIGGAVVFGLGATKKSAETQARLVPSIDQHGGGFAVVGKF
jgi:hypothetical protein